MTIPRTALALVLFCTPAFALDGDDAAKKPAPAPGGDAKDAAQPDAKKERKADPAAEKLLQRYIGLVHFPATDGLKSVSGKGDIEQQGMTIGINPKWTAEKGFDIDLTLPKEAKDQLAQMGANEEQANAAVKSQMMMTGVNAPFDPPAKSREHFDITVTPKGDDQLVEMTPFDDKADAASRKYVFGKDGLLKSSSVEPKPNGQMPAGVTFDSEWTFEKKGERYVVAARKLSIPMAQQELETKFTYYDGPGGSVVLKTATVSSAMQGEQVIKFHDYTVDGKLVESTKAPPKTDDKAKPAEKPFSGPDAPPK